MKAAATTMKAAAEPPLPPTRRTTVERSPLTSRIRTDLARSGIIEIDLIAFRP